VPLAFSPLSEDILSAPPKRLYPGHAFVMRQIGAPPVIDQRMAEIVREVFEVRGVMSKDADASTGGGDFLERILGLIRATGFTVAIFSHETRASAMANITLELGFAAMCGKPLVIVKSKEARPPSDLTRTDWIEYDPADEARFRAKLGQALDTIEEVGAFQDFLLQTALEARSIDCAVALERASKAFLLTSDATLIDKAEVIAERLEAAGAVDGVADLDRLRAEVSMFVRQGRAALAGAAGA
jgi:hypothetical protein